MGAECQMALGDHRRPDLKPPRRIGQQRLVARVMEHLTPVHDAFVFAVTLPLPAPCGATCCREFLRRGGVIWISARASDPALER